MTRAGWIALLCILLAGAVGLGAVAYGHAHDWSVPLSNQFHLAFLGKCGHAVVGPFGATAVQGVIDGYAVYENAVVGRIAESDPGCTASDVTPPGFFILDTVHLGAKTGLSREQWIKWLPIVQVNSPPTLAKPERWHVFFPPDHPR